MTLVRTALRAVELAAGPASPAAASRLLYPKSDGWYQKDSAGVESKLGSMTGTKISALSAASTLTGSEQFAAVQGGSTKAVTAAQINAFTEPIAGGSTAAVTGYASDTYLAGSMQPFVPARLQAAANNCTIYKCEWEAIKTAAGVATATVIVRVGTAGTTADTTRLTFTFPSAQTAAIDNMYCKLLVNFRAVGASAQIAGTLILVRSNTTTGFLSTGATTLTIIKVTSSTFDITAQSKIGVSVNGGASASWTTSTVQSELLGIV